MRPSYHNLSTVPEGIVTREGGPHDALLREGECMSEHRGLDHKGVMRDCVQEVHFCIDDYGPPIEPKKWRTIVVDPPWRYQRTLVQKGVNGKAIRGAAAHYGTMSLAELAALRVGTWAEADAHLYLWATNTLMLEALMLCDQWGFKQKTILTWVKPGIGLGSYFRNSTERQFMNAVVEHAERSGWLVFHDEDSRKNRAGFPDLCMVRGPSGVVFAELKREKGTLRLAQEEWLDALAAAECIYDCVRAFVWRPSDWPEIERVLR